jgi:hypothetical protein
MSNENDQTITRNNFASRLLNRAISERKKTGEISLTAVEAVQYAVPEEEKTETAVTVQS